jgi:hypothetical protein
LEKCRRLGIVGVDVEDGAVVKFSGHIRTDVNSRRRQQWLGRDDAIPVDQLKQFAMLLKNVKVRLIQGNGKYINWRSTASVLYGHCSGNKSG